MHFPRRHLYSSKMSKVKIELKENSKWSSLVTWKITFVFMLPYWNFSCLDLCRYMLNAFQRTVYFWQLVGFEQQWKNPKNKHPKRNPAFVSGDFISIQSACQASVLVFIAAISHLLLSSFNGNNPGNHGNSCGALPSSGSPEPSTSRPTWHSSKVKVKDNKEIISNCHFVSKQSTGRTKQKGNKMQWDLDSI